MRRYETFVILDPDLSEEGRAPVIDRIEETITKQNAFLVKVDDWGARKLAYAIKKKNRGYYVRLDYCGGGPLVNELERFFRIDDRVLKYMTVLLEEQADVDMIKEEMAQAEAQAAENAQSQPDASVESDASEASSDESATSDTPIEPVEETAQAESTPAKSETAEPETKEPEVEPVADTKEE